MHLSVSPSICLSSFREYQFQQVEARVRQEEYHRITSSYNLFIIMRTHRWPYGPCFSSNFMVFAHFYDICQISWFFLIFMKAAKFHGLCFFFYEVGKIRQFLLIFMKSGKVSWFLLIYVFFLFFIKLAKFQGFCFFSWFCLFL